MNYVRQKVTDTFGSRSSSNKDSNGNSNGNNSPQAIMIRPGQVEKATHTVPYAGTISLSGLRFWAYYDPTYNIDGHYNSNSNSNSNSNNNNGNPDNDQRLSNTNANPNPNAYLYTNAYTNTNTNTNAKAIAIANAYTNTNKSSSAAVSSAASAAAAASTERYEEQSQKQHEDQQNNRAINLYLDDEEQYTNTTQDQDLDQDLDLDLEQEHRAIDHSEMAALSSSSLEEKEINNNSDNENQEEIRRNVNRYNNNNKNQQQQQQQQHRTDSYIDIVVLEVPKYCSTTHPCDLSKYGVGQIQHLEQNPAMEFLSLCDTTTGRLRIDKEKFRGYRTQLYIPPAGFVMKDRIIDSPYGGGRQNSQIPAIPSDKTKFELLVANCDTQAYGHGRTVELTGQVVFEADNPLFGDGHTSQDTLDVVSQVKLIALGVLVCLLFSMFSMRVRSGTRADWLHRQSSSFAAAATAAATRGGVPNGNNNNSNSSNSNTPISSSSTNPQTLRPAETV